MNQEDDDHLLSENEGGIVGNQNVFDLDPLNNLLKNAQKSAQDLLSMPTHEDFPTNLFSGPFPSFEMLRMKVKKWGNRHKHEFTVKSGTSNRVGVKIGATRRIECRKS